MCVCACQFACATDCFVSVFWWMATRFNLCFLKALILLEFCCECVPRDHPMWIMLKYLLEMIFNTRRDFNRETTLGELYRSVVRGWMALLDNHQFRLFRRFDGASRSNRKFVNQRECQSVMKCVVKTIVWFLVDDRFNFESFNEGVESSTKRFVKII